MLKVAQNGSQSLVEGAMRLLITVMLCSMFVIFPQEGLILHDIKYDDGVQFEVFNPNSATHTIGYIYFVKDKTLYIKFIGSYLIDRDISKVHIKRKVDNISFLYRNT